MKRISIPLVVLADGRVVYEGDPESWFLAAPVGDRLVGYYSGPLYSEDGQKLFGWSEYETDAPAGA